MTDYTPTLDELREAYQATGDGLDFKRRHDERAAEFDRAIAKVKADALREAGERYEPLVGGPYFPKVVSCFLRAEAARIESEAGEPQ